MRNVGLVDEVVLIAPIDHPWVQRDVIEAHELLHERLILREESSGTYQVMMQALIPLDISAGELHQVMQLGNSEAIIMVVEAGIGVGFVPRVSATRFMQMGKITAIAIKDVTMAHTIWMAESNIHPAIAPQIEFVKMLRHEDVQGMLNGESSSGPILPAQALAPEFA